MGDLDFVTFRRCLLRSAEIAAEPGMKTSIVRVYEETLRSHAEAFLAADSAVAKADATMKEKTADANSALWAFDTPYREARSMVRAYAPHSALPDTLLAQPTDTQKVDAVKGLLAAFSEYHGSPWADELAQGKIGQQAVETMAKVNEWSAAGAALASARIARSTAFAPAYERFIRFKRLVRDALGSKSRQYRRLHPRANTGEKAETEEKPAATQASTAAPAPQPAMPSAAQPGAQPAMQSKAQPGAQPAMQSKAQPSLQPPSQPTLQLVP